MCHLTKNVYVRDYYGYQLPFDDINQKLLLYIFFSTFEFLQYPLVLLFIECTSWTCLYYMDIHQTNRYWVMGGLYNNY